MRPPSSSTRTVQPKPEARTYFMPKLAQIARWKKERELGFYIEVDGGIGPAQAPTVVDNGGEILVAASAVFGGGDPAAGVAALRVAAEG